MIQTNSEANSTTQRLFSVMYPSQNLENTQFYDDDNDKTGTEEADRTLDRTVEKVFERVEEGNEEIETILRKRRRDATKLDLGLIFTNLDPSNVEYLKQEQEVFRNQMHSE
ncbi:hypothetical protein G6F56_003595 [Rhizopus delemar]|nr:hypothetical protein G6F56_003595 [Rhizopus delemar]